MEPGSYGCYGIERGDLDEMRGRYVAPEPGQPVIREFADDPMMRELHTIREKHSQEAKSTPATEHNRLVSFLSSSGYRLVSTKRGTRKLIKTKR